jgi:hypothetical protein
MCESDVAAPDTCGQTASGDIINKNKIKKIYTSFDFVTVMNHALIYQYSKYQDQ